MKEKKSANSKGETSKLVYSNKKGFTLIELLAIIVILAIIGVITIPILLNVIDTSNKGAAIDSAYGFKEAVNKYFLTESMDNNQLKLDGMYSINEGVLNGNTISNKEIPVSGKKPSKGYLKYDNNKLVLACLVLGDYEVKYENNEFTSTGKGNCTIKGDFANDTWETIVSNLSIDRHAYDDDLLAGTTKEIELDLNGNNTISDDEKFNVRIANTSTPTICSTEGFSQTACGFVVEFVDIITNYQMNGTDFSTCTNVGGWPASEMRTFVNGTIYNALPTEVKNAIIPTTVVSSHGPTSGETNFNSTDNLYLLSTHEVWEDVDGNTSSGNDYYDTSYSLTRQLDYYKNNNVTTSSYAKVIKKKSGSAYHWWLRSVRSDSISSFGIVNSSGISVNGYSNYAYGVAPAFRILD